MPRRKFLRRFDPFASTSLPAVEAEAKYVAREFDNYMLLSLTDLQERHATRKRFAQQFEVTAVARISMLGERERLVVLCLIWRDFAHLAKLYEAFLSAKVSVAVNESPPSPDRSAVITPTVALPFQETLFE